MPQVSFTILSKNVLKLLSVYMGFFQFTLKTAISKLIFTWETN